MPTLTETKRCTSCGDEKLLEEFQLARKGSPERHNNCNLCHARYQRRRRLQRRRKDMNAVARDFVEMHHKTKNYHELANVVAEVSRQFGGAKKLGAAMADAFHAARAADKPHIVLRWYLRRIIGLVNRT